MLLTRRDTLAAILGSAALAACARGGGEVLKIGNQRGSTKALIEAAGQLDGLSVPIEWSEFPAAQHLLEAIGAGAVDLGVVGDAPFLFAYQSGSPIKSVQAARFEPRNAASAILVSKTSTIRSVAELAGRKVTTGRGSAGHFLLLRALERAKVPAGAVDIVFLPPGDAKSAFSSGSVDAWSTWSPYSAAAILQEGARVIADGRELVTGYGFVAANAASIDAKRALIAPFLERYAEAQRWQAGHVDTFATVLARETGLPIDVARFTADRNLVPIRTDAPLIEEQKGVLATFAQAGAAEIRRPIEDAFDTSFDRQLPPSDA